MPKSPANANQASMRYKESQLFAVLDAETGEVVMGEEEKPSVLSITPLEQAALKVRMENPGITARKLAEKAGIAPTGNGGPQAIIFDYKTNPVKQAFVQDALLAHGCDLGEILGTIVDGMRNASDGSGNKNYDQRHKNARTLLEATGFLGVAARTNAANGENGAPHQQTVTSSLSAAAGTLTPEQAQETGDALLASMIRRARAVQTGVPIEEIPPIDFESGRRKATEAIERAGEESESSILAVHPVSLPAPAELSSQIIDEEPYYDDEDEEGGGD
jgi:hypothetical protein